MEHQGIKIEFIGQIEMYYDRGNHHEFISLVKELARPGEMIAHSSYPFEFSCVEKPFEVYTGGHIDCYINVLQLSLLVEINDGILKITQTVI